MVEEWTIAGKKFLITGGASGLGAAYAESFLKYGAENVAILDIDEHTGKDFVQKLNETYKDKAIFIRCDVSKYDEIDNSFEEVVNAFKTVDVIVNNAGILNDDPNIWKTASAVNWQGLVSFTLKGVALMRKDEGGSGGTIINISSGAAFVKFSIVPIYSGTKAAVLHFGRSLATPEFNDITGVRLLTLILCATDTALIENLSSKTFDKTISKPLLSSLQFFAQSTDSAVAAVMKMFCEGAPGSVWLSRHDRPGEDITAIVDGAYEQIEKLFQPDGFDT